MAAQFREEFDPARKLIVRRSMTCSGLAYSPGDTFDTTKVPTRRTRMLFNQRTLAMEGEDPRRITKPPAPQRFGRWAPKAPDIAPEPPQDAQVAAGAPFLPEGWDSLPWFSLRGVVKTATGILARDKAHALELIAEETARRGGTP